MTTTAMNRRQRVLGGSMCLVCLLPLLGSGTAWAATPTEPPIRVAIYDHSGGVKKTAERLKRFLTEPAGFDCHRVTPRDILDGSLRDFDVLIMPGGSARKQAAHLGTRGRPAALADKDTLASRRRASRG